VQSADIEGQRRSYRRGVVLGLTMAEIMTLVIFAMLLVMAALSLARQEQIAGLEDEVATLRPLVAKIGSLPGTPKQIEDIFQQFERSKAEAAALTAALADARESERQKADALHAAEARSAELKKELAAAQQRATKLEKQLAAAQAHASDLDGQLAAAQAHASDVDAQLTAAQAHVSDLEKQLAASRAEAAHQPGLGGNGDTNPSVAAKGGGRGTKYPPCWPAETTGKPEYIFDASITSAGVVMRDNALPARAADQARLPIQALEFGHVIDHDTFLRETAALLKWSTQQVPECRFFVRLYDRTGDAEKARFKKGLMTVEVPFYKYLMENVAGAP
jgi:hypothetical protein